MGLSVVIVDDNEAFLAAAGALLESQDMRLVGTATNAEDAVERVRQEGPDVVVVDLHLGSTSGLALAGRLADGSPDAPAVVLVSTVGYDDLAALSDGSPVRGFLTKTDLSATAIETIVCGTTPSA